MHNISVVCLNKNDYMTNSMCVLHQRQKDSPHKTNYLRRRSLCAQGLADFDSSLIIYPFLPSPYKQKTSPLSETVICMEKSRYNLLPRASLEIRGAVIPL